MIDVIFITTIIILFLTFFVSTLLLRNVTMEILRIIKSLDYKKWLYLVSFQYGMLNKARWLIWVNPLRFESFVNSENCLNSKDVEALKIKYKRCKKPLLLSFGVLILLTILLFFLAIITASPCSG